MGVIFLEASSSGISSSEVHSPGICSSSSLSLSDLSLDIFSLGVLILLDTPLFLNRAMAPLERNLRHVEEYKRTKDVIAQFWLNHRDSLFPWDPNGPVLTSIVAERFSAIVSIAKQDLRTEEGRKFLLASDELDHAHLDKLADLEKRLSGIGDKRFIHWNSRRFYSHYGV